MQWSKKHNLLLNLEGKYKVAWKGNTQVKHNYLRIVHKYRLIFSFLV